MPGPTTPRTIRISDEDWAEIERLAAREGLSSSEYMRRLALAPAEAHRTLGQLNRIGKLLAQVARELAALAQRLGSR